MNFQLSIFKRAFEALGRNWLTAIPSMLVIAIILIMFHGLLAVQEKAAETINTLTEKFSFTVYLKDDADPFEIGNLITALEERRDVIPPVAYTSKEAAWNFMSRTFGLDPNLSSKYRFSLPASLTIKPRKPEDAQIIEAFLTQEATHLLRDPNATKDQQKKLTTQMLEFIRRTERGVIGAIFLFAALFVIGGTLLLATTIHLGFQTRKLEINIMKLVGAAPSTMVLPFVVEGIFLGLLSFALYLIFLFILPIGFKNTPFHWNAVLLEFLATVSLSGLVSYAAAAFHLKRKPWF